MSAKLMAVEFFRDLTENMLSNFVFLIWALGCLAILHAYVHWSLFRNPQFAPKFKINYSLRSFYCQFYVFSYIIQNPNTLQVLQTNYYSSKRSRRLLSIISEFEGQIRFSGLFWSFSGDSFSFGGVLQYPKTVLDVKFTPFCVKNSAKASSPLWAAKV